MSRIFALADLHLSGTGRKPMDVFGEIWRDHTDVMARRWDRDVRTDDVVLLPGDLSWARNLKDAAPDLAWIGARPGLKYLLRGNHDSWWTSASKVRHALPPGCHALQNDAFDLGPAILVGARGWTAPEDPIATADDLPVFRREIERLRLSLEDAARRWPGSKPRIAMVHYPPVLVGVPPSDVAALLTEAGVRHCVYGHLHGADHARGFQGTHEGVTYQLVAADAIGFAPAPVTLRPRET